MKRMIGIVLTALIVLGCLTSVALAMGNPQYKLDDKTVNVGETFTVDVAISDNPGIISLRYKVVYDETALQLLKVEDKSLLKGFTTPFPTISSPYTLRWADSLATVNNAKNGTVVTLTFKALKEVSATEIRIEHGEARTCTGQKVSFVNGTADVAIKAASAETYHRGDIDRDGDVDVDDVLALLWYVLFPDDYPI